MTPSARPPQRERASTLAAVAVLALLTSMVAACGDRTVAGNAPPATATASSAASVTAAATVSETPRATPAPDQTPRPAWPPPLGVAPIDSALAALRAGDGAALLALVRPAAAACTTATGAGGPPKCPDGVASGTVIEYFPNFACDGWGSAEDARSRLIDPTTYPLVVLGWTPPIASRTVPEQAITHTVVFVRGGFGAPDPTSDARLLTTLAFDGVALREIAGDCGAYSQAAFIAGELPHEATAARVIWRAYTASGAR